MKNVKWSYLTLMIIIIFVLIFILKDNIIGKFNTETNNKSNIVSNNETNKTNEKVYEHTFPERVSKNDSFKGEFISNDIASVYPRREALVKDILVDIGDTVKAGDTLAILLEPGVLGEADSKINIKNTLVSTKKGLLYDIKEVKKAKLSEIDTKVNEKEIVIIETEKNINARISQLESLINNKTIGEDFSIENSLSQILVEENNLKILENNFNTKISQLKSLIDNKTIGEDFSIENALSQILVEEKNLEILEKNLENALSSQTEKLSDSNNNITQKEDLLDMKIEEVFYGIIPMFYIGNENNINYGSIEENNISYLFGAKNTGELNNLLSKIRSFQNNKDRMSILEKYEELISVNNLLINSLKNSIISSGTITDSTISTYINSINTYNNSLLAIKENYDDALKNYDILIKSQNEKIENLKKQIEKQKEVINLKKNSHDVVNSGKTEKIDNLELELEKVKIDKSLQIERQKDIINLKKNTYNILSSGKTEKIENLELELDKVKTDKSLQVEKLKAELETLKKSKNLLDASENRNITAIQNEIAMAKADLNREYIASGDYKIISPFSGIISKRNLEIGQKISPSLEAFRLTGVKTTLSKITKKEVKFYVPENLKENLELEKEVYFSIGDEKTKSFTGTIYRISPEIDEKNFSITVQARVDDKINLPNKSTLRVNLETVDTVFKIPTTAIYNKDERKIVYYKKDNGKLGVKDINILSDDGEYSLVSGDFDEKLKVVTTPIFIK